MFPFILVFWLLRSAPFNSGGYRRPRSHSVRFIEHRHYHFVRAGIRENALRSNGLGRLPPPSFQLRVVLRSPSLRFGELNTTLRCLRRGDYG